MSFLSRPLDIEFLTLSRADLTVVTLVTSSVVYFIFHRYEPDSPKALFSILLMVPSGLGLLAHRSTGSGISSIVTAFSYYFIIIFFAISYRLSPFHPLAKFPGPILNRISKLQSFRMVVRGHLHQYYQELHQQYGDIVRVGPNELSYVNVDGIRGTLNSGLPKGPFYRRPGNTVSLVGARDAVTHTRLRKPWNRAFSTSSLKDYEAIVVGRARELIENLERRHLQEVDIAEWMGFFSFDFMGDLLFSFSFDMMKDGYDTHDYWKTITASLKRMGIFSQMPWALRYVLSPWNPFKKVETRTIAKMMVAHRLKAGSMTRDVFYHLSHEDGKDVEKTSPKQLVAEGIIAIVAGSDTTATVLSNLWYYLMRHPMCMDRLRKEVDANFAPGEEPLDQERLSAMRYLNACINESLRLQPPVPSGSQRMVAPGAGSKMVGSHYIPEGNNILVPTYALHRDPRYFSPSPESFWPDRWLEPESRMDINDASKPLGDGIKVILEEKAFAPFSSGPAICVGKTLAMQEMRIVASWIIQKFDLQPAPGYDMDDWEKGLCDYFVLQKGSLPVVLTPRK